VSRTTLMSSTAFVLALCAASADAEVTRVTIARRADIGMSGYEKIAGTLSFAVGPGTPRREFSADLYVIKPKAPERSNGSALVELSARGARTLLRQFNLANVNPDPEADFELGDKFLMRFGFTLAWVAVRVDGPADAAVAFAAVRDFASWLKYQRNDVVSVRYAYAYGAGDDGGLLRDFMEQGFNTDARERQVFDGVWIHAGGTTPTRWIETTRPREHEPRVFYSITAADYWDPAHTAAPDHTPDDAGDGKPPDNVRLYFLAGTAREPGRFPPSLEAGRPVSNPLDYTWTLRALLLAMHRWVRDGKAPPASAYPTLADRTLVRADALSWPAIPGASPPRPAVPALVVPAVDEDGNERAGIRLPDVAAPLATYAGWGFVPFPATRASRGTMKDPRRSIEERYASRDGYLAEVEKLAEALVLQGFLLIDDVPRIVQRSTDMWDLLTTAQRIK
jgi:Alpha/beta hydrolase domain